MLQFIDTHAHLDGEEFKDDLPEVMLRAKAAGVKNVFLPSINLPSVDSVLAVCGRFPGYALPMIGLHPEEVKADFKDVLAAMRSRLDASLQGGGGSPQEEKAGAASRFIAIGEVGLDFYWSREYENEQLEAFEEQVKWSVETRLPLMIHCRKAQNELVSILRKYEKTLPGGVFHCFTGNRKEAGELLAFPRFVLGIGGVCTFKSSHLREDLPAAVPLERIVLETDSPYMTPVPRRGERNESAFVGLVLRQLADSYGVTEEEVARITNGNVNRVFGLNL